MQLSPLQSFFASVQDPSVHFLSLSQQAILQSGIVQVIPFAQDAASLQDPSEHFLSLSQQAILHSVFAQVTASFLAQQDLFIEEQEEMANSTNSVSKDKIFIKIPYVKKCILVYQISIFIIVIVRVLAKSLIGGTLWSLD